MSAYGTKVAEAFSAKTLPWIYARSIFDQLVNRDYEGEIVDVGSKLNILNFDKLSEKTYDGTNMSVDSVGETNVQLTIDQYKSFYFKVRTIDQFVSYIKDPKTTLWDQALNERAKNVDTFVLGKYAKVGAGNRVGTDYTTGTVTITTGTGAVVGSGTTFTSGMVGRGFKATGHSKWYRVATFTDTTHITIENDSDDLASSYDGGTITGATYTIEANTPIQLTTSNIMQEVLALKQKLDAQEVPESDRVLVLPTEAAALIPRGTNISLSTPAAYEELVKKGYITELVGFKIFSSARLTGDNTNGYHALAIHKSWMTFADKQLKSQMEEDLIGNFGSAYKDLYVYGAKVADARRKFAAELFCYV